MNKIFILSALGAILTVPAIAGVQRCVALNSSTTCSFAVPEDQASVWESSCTTNGQYVPIRGVIACGTEYGDLGETADTVYASSNSSNCWCKAISPAISKWVSVGEQTETSVAGCEMKCATDCAQFMSENVAFRNAIISTMGQN